MNGMKHSLTAAAAVLFLAVLCGTVSCRRGPAGAAGQSATGLPAAATAPAATAPAADSPQVASFDDALVATDALGRELPLYEEAGDIRPNHYVGLFYWLWHRKLRNPSEEEWDYNVTLSNKKDPGRTDWQFADYYWAKPELGYYKSSDKFVLQKHIDLFCLLGIDFLFLDFTNNLRDTLEMTALLEVVQDFRAKGYDPPRIVPFFNSGIDEGGKPYSYIERYYNLFVKDGKYADCWFIYKGKPLILSPVVHGDPEIAGAFTWKKMWAAFPRSEESATTWRFYDSYKTNGGPTPAVDEDGNIEQMVVSKGIGAPLWGGMTYGGGSSTTKHVPVYDEYLLSEDTGKGLFFEEQAAAAMEIQPPVLCVTGWNEWIAGAWHADKTLAGAKMQFRGVPVKVGDFYFVDEFNEEFNRDFEPQENPEYSDNFYYQLAGFLRRYKGMAPRPEASRSRKINLGGSFRQWDKVRPAFRDYAGELRTRNSAGAPKGTAYVNETARNDFQEMKVTYDRKNVWFYVQTAGDITPRTDANWMLLYIDADRDKETGWEGYDYAVNMEVLSDGLTTLKARRGEGWETVCECPYRMEGDRMMVGVPRQALGLDGAKPSFYFHWVDNIQKLDDIGEFFVNGDSAPERRYNYWYEAK